MQSHLRIHPRCIFGSYIASNTADAFARACETSMHKLMNFLKKTK